MAVVITYGTFDLLHHGHIRLLERAKELGDYLIVGVTSDDFDRRRGKINVQQDLSERMESVKATGIPNKVIVEEYAGQKIDDIIRYGVDVFAIGSDWKGKFDYLKEYCEVVYLERTKGISSTELRNASRSLRLGLVGDSPYLEKVFKESKYVNGVDVVGAYCGSESTCGTLDSQGVQLFESLGELLANVDAVHISSHPKKHVDQIAEALAANVHVLAESPLTVSTVDYRRLHREAHNKELILADALRTAYSTAYERLRLLIKSGHIGRVVAVDVACTSLRVPEDSARDIGPDAWGSLHMWGPAAMLPIFEILGTEYLGMDGCVYYADEENGFDLFSKINFTYPDAVGSLKVGLGVKSESELVITGTKGYAYVPAPWWKTDYFELRYENPAENKRFFYQLEGEGIRFELLSFAKAVDSGRRLHGVPEAVSEAIVSALEECRGSDQIVRLESLGRGSDYAGETVQ